MNIQKQLIGVLTEQDLVSAWVSMLQTTEATHVEVDLDELCMRLMYETRIHYSRQNLKHPLKLMLQDFNRTKWQWLRLQEKVKNAR